MNHAGEERELLADGDLVGYSGSHIARNPSWIFLLRSLSRSETRPVSRHIFFFERGSLSEYFPLVPRACVRVRRFGSTAFESLGCHGVMPRGRLFAVERLTYVSRWHVEHSGGFRICVYTMDMPIWDSLRPSLLGAEAVRCVPSRSCVLVFVPTAVRESGMDSSAPHSPPPSFPVAPLERETEMGWVRLPRWCG